MKSWRVVVEDAGGVKYYIVDAEDKKAAEARAFRLHCSTPDWNSAKRAFVRDAETKEWTGS